MKMNLETIYGLILQIIKSTKCINGVMKLQTESKNTTLNMTLLSPNCQLTKFQILRLYSKIITTYENFWYATTDELSIQKKISSTKLSGLYDKGKDVETYIARLEEEWKELKIISEQLDSCMPSYYSTMSHIIELIWECNSLVMPVEPLDF